MTRISDAEVRDRIGRASSVISDPAVVDRYVLSLAVLSLAVATMLRDSDAFEGVRPTDAEIRSGAWPHRTEELHARQAASDWRVRYLVGLESTPRPGMVADWQARLLADISVLPRPEAGWLRRLWRRVTGGGR
jgi:hypothetical protein